MNMSACCHPTTLSSPWSKARYISSINKNIIIAAASASSHLHLKCGSRSLQAEFGLQTIRNHHLRWNMTTTLACIEGTMYLTRPSKCLSWEGAAMMDKEATTNDSSK
ncbi:hypothetical protein QTG54_001468 [Skeletonema marinoi]|uniref:Uncharacterized protein n=1 Tax=Skeletonema marinoi TaxID=267567 RepID=A0AAD8YLF4_9STRA|nr:hypothetical protein QTG54_001468 [Skeletonema marinoi]